MNGVRDTEQFSIGQWGETEVRDWLASRPGCFVIPVNAIEVGGAPRAINALRSVTLPDLGVMASGTGEWWEVKTKRRMIWNQKRGKHVHGVAKRLWHDYLTVERESGWRGHLAVIEQCPPRLITAKFARLDNVLLPHVGSWETFGEEMVWFDVEDFDIMLVGPQWRTPSPPPMPITVIHPWPEPSQSDYLQCKLPFAGEP